MEIVIHIVYCRNTLENCDMIISHTPTVNYSKIFTVHQICSWKRTFFNWLRWSLDYFASVTATSPMIPLLLLNLTSTRKESLSWVLATLHYLPNKQPWARERMTQFHLCHPTLFSSNVEAPTLHLHDWTQFREAKMEVQLKTSKSGINDYFPIRAHTKCFIPDMTEITIATSYNRNEPHSVLVVSYS